MKKQSIFIFSFILLVLFLIGCDKGVSKPIVLPSVKEINSIGITDGEAKFASNDKDVISKITDIISTSTITYEESVHDAPNQENYIKIDLITKENTTTFFMYFDNGSLKLEQPYIGIYLVDNRLNEVINGIYDFNFKDE